MFLMLQSLVFVLRKDVAPCTLLLLGLSNLVFHTFIYLTNDSVVQFVYQCFTKKVLQVRVFYSELINFFE